MQSSFYEMVSSYNHGKGTRAHRAEEPWALASRVIHPALFSLSCFSTCERVLWFFTYTSRSQHRVAMTTTALCLSYVRAVDATLAYERLHAACQTARLPCAMLRPLRGHLCITYHLNPRQTPQHQPD